MAGVEATRSPLEDMASLEQRWRALEAQSIGSFFLSWDWIGPWLSACGARPDVIHIRRNGAVIGLALIGHENQKRLLGRVPTLRLNEAGDLAADRAFIEHNGILSIAGEEDVTAMALAKLLAADRSWEAVLLSGVEYGAPLLDRLPVKRRLLLDDSPVYGIDLDAVRAAGDYLACLSANTRQQIRRALKDRGTEPLTVRRLTSTDAVTQGLSAMAELNAGRHVDNAWDQPVFRRFAKALCDHGAARGVVDLLEITQAGDSVGYLLNFVHRGRVMNYQSAFIAPQGPKDKPGLLSHAAAIADYAARGDAHYSLLAGRDQYKQSLSTTVDRMYWWRLERRSLRQDGEYWLRRILRR